MKKILLLATLAAVWTGCSDESDIDVTPAPAVNKVMMLQVDYTTNAFEGGKEMEFNHTTTPGFTISKIYHSPGDFGDITLKYEQVNDTLFFGTIHWMGLGQRYFPETINVANDFIALQQNLAMPAASAFEIIDTYEGEVPQPAPDITPVWNAIDNLQKVKEYRELNPDAKIYVYLYTPSVGVGNPEDWNWLVFLKN